MDTYECFAELAHQERDGRDFQVRIKKVPNSSTVIIAPHGGGIEPGTSEIADAIARNDLSFGAFEGIKTTDNRVLHITSTNFDEPRCLELVQCCQFVLTIHGESGDDQRVYVGGRDELLSNSVYKALDRNGFEIAIHNRPMLQGKSVRNICNRGITNAGVQLEISSGLRRMFFRSLDAAGRGHPTIQLAEFADAVRLGLASSGAI